MSTISNTVYFEVGNAKLTRRILKRCRELRITIEYVTEYQCIYGNTYASVLLGYRVPSDIFESVRAEIDFDLLFERQKSVAMVINSWCSGQLIDASVELSALDVCKQFKIPKRKTKSALFVPQSTLGLVQRLLASPDLKVQVRLAEHFVQAIDAVPRLAQSLTAAFEHRLEPRVQIPDIDSIRLCELFGIPHVKDGEHQFVPSAMMPLLTELTGTDYLVDQVSVVESHIRQEHERQKKAEFTRKFPNAPQATIDRFSLSSIRVFASMDSVPLALLTKMEIEEMNLSSVGIPEAYLLEEQGAVIAPLFSAKLKTRGPTSGDRSSEFPTPQKALQIVNKLAKIVVPLNERSRIYRIKDELIKLWQEHLVDGRVTRQETRECNRCHGGPCSHCNGTGIYSMRYLYEHIFRLPGDDRLYSFHSYQRPRFISEEKGADKQEFGFRLRRKIDGLLLATISNPY